MRNLTQKMVDAASAKKRYYRVPDGTVPGLNLKVFPTGRKFYTLRYRPIRSCPMKEMTLGPTEVYTLKEARDRAKEHLAKMWNGEDVIPPRAVVEAGMTLTELWHTYVQSQTFSDLAPATKKGKVRIFERYILPALGKEPIKLITKSQFIEFAEKILKTKRKSIADKVVADMSALMSFAERRDLIAVNVCKNTTYRFTKNIRKRVLTQAEIGRLKTLIAEAGRKEDIRDVIRICMFTGQRRAEVAEMEWQELDFDRLVWIIPEERTKANRETLVPLTPQVVRILEKYKTRAKKGRVFDVKPNSVSVFVNTHIKNKFEDPVVLHDLRRSMASTLQKLRPKMGVELIERILNHADDKKGKAIKHYAHYDYEAEKRDLLTEWENYVMEA